MNKNFSITLFTFSLLVSGNAFSSSFTSTSSSGFDVTTVGASTIGGIVADLEGLNGAHVVSQLSASSLFSGFSGANNPLLIGTQTGFNSTTTNALGGGLVSASFRFTLEDGDTAAGEFDFGDNDLIINGLNFGDWSLVNAEQTNSLGVAGAAGQSGGGFRDNTLDTGWFSSIDSTLLGQLFSSLTSTEALIFGLDDVDPDDNFLDFTLGIDNSLIGVGQGPTVTPPTGTVPEPTSLALLVLGLATFRFSRKNTKA